MHGKYIYQSAILQSQFIKSFARYAATPFYAAGSGKDTESEEEDFVFHELGYWILVTGFWLLDSGCWILDAGFSPHPSTVFSPERFRPPLLKERRTNS